MSEPWVILTRRYGETVRSPSTEQLAEAIAELYHEVLPGMTEGDQAEHGAGSLRFGFDDGPMLVLEVNRLREVRLEEWADQDYEQELAPARRMQLVPEEYALRLWRWLAQGRLTECGHSCGSNRRTRRSSSPGPLTVVRCTMSLGGPGF